MDKKQKRQMIAKRIAAELEDGFFVNLGIGIPTMVANYIPEGKTVLIESENGILGVGASPEPENVERDLINAGGGHITMVKGASLFDTFESFSMIRGGHIDMAVLGALQVDAKGNLANWMIPGVRAPGMGGAMDLVSGAKQVIAATDHLDRYGKSKVLKECTLPLTGSGVLTMIVTDMAAMRITDEGLLLVDIAEGYTLKEVIAATDADLIIPDHIGTYAP